MFSGPNRLLLNKSKIAVFISGTGSTLQSLLDMHHQANIALIVTNRKSAMGALKAKRFGKTIHFLTKEDSELNVLSDKLKKIGVDTIFLLGFMKILPKSFVEKWPNKIINIHPSLLPHYAGLKSLERAWSDKQPIGATIHHVVEEVDSGAHILQRKSLDYADNTHISQASLFHRFNEQFLIREMAMKIL